jgi:hypothetical protein
MCLGKDPSSIVRWKRMNMWKNYKIESDTWKMRTISQVYNALPICHLSLKLGWRYFSVYFKFYWKEVGYGMCLLKTELVSCWRSCSIGELHCSQKWDVFNCLIPVAAYTLNASLSTLLFYVIFHLQGNLLYTIWTSQGGDYEEFYLLGYNAVWYV